MSEMKTSLKSSGFNYISKSSYFESKHKSKPDHFSSIEGGRLKRTENRSLLRKSARIGVFDNAREISPQPQISANDLKTQRRRIQLQKWKEEKEKKKLEEANKKKKPFVVGTVSAPLAFELPPPPKQNVSGRVLRSQANKNKHLPPTRSKKIQPAPQGTADFFANIEKNIINKTESFAPANATFRPPKIDIKFITSLSKNSDIKPKGSKQVFEPFSSTSSDKKTNPVLKLKSVSAMSSVKSVTASKDAVKTVRVTRQNTKLAGEKNMSTIPTEKLNKLNTKNDKQTSSLMASKTTHKKKVVETPKSESSFEERLRTPEENMNTSKAEVGKMSPFITVSRGKNNARKEAINKIKEGILGDEVHDEKTVSDFRNQLNSEIQRLRVISDEWDEYLKQNTLPEHIQELVLAAVGQTRLLITKKFQQFSQLVETCARGESRPEGIITTADLQGFWDMVFMQVENVDMRFKKLSELRQMQWQEPETVKPKRRVSKKKKEPVPVASGPSKIRAMIEAARKAAQSQKEESISLPAAGSDSKCFEAGFFTVTSPVRLAAARTPVSGKQASMLKGVLSSEARKASGCKVSASKAMIRASLISKNIDTFEQAPSCLSPVLINLHATPARSILKTPLSTRKSAKTVLFIEEPSSVQNVGFKPLVITPEKPCDDNALKPTQENTPKAEIPNKTRRNRSSRSSRVDQENDDSVVTPPRRMTRNMRRSILLENQDSPLVELDGVFSKPR